LRKSYLHILLFIVALPILLKAQIPGNSLSFVKKRYSFPHLISHFDKQLQTYNYGEKFNYGKQFNKLFLGLNQTFISTLINSTHKSVRDNFFLSLLGEYDFYKNLSAGANTNYYVYSDDKQLAINNSSIFNTSAFIKYHPLKNLSITPFAGISRNEQIGITDTGPLYGGEALINNFNFNEFNLFSAFKFQNEDISPRKNSIVNMKINLNKSFQNYFSNQLFGLYSEQRKDFYFDTDSLTMGEFQIEKNIQSRTESKYSIVDRLNFVSLIPGMSLNIEGSIDWRKIDRETRYVSLSNISTSSFDTEIEEFKMNFFTSLKYVSSRYYGIIRANFSEREEKHRAKNIKGVNEIIFEKRDEQEKRKNNTGKQITISGEGSYYLTRNNRISFSLFHRKLTYDTPSELNFDDRDELLSMFSINYFSRLSPYFNLFTTLQGSINKTVYIFKERSANNNTLRVIKLLGESNLHLKYLSSKNSAEISANYTVYDFEDLNPNLKSFSYRMLNFRDSTTANLFGNVYLKFLGYIKFSEQGDFLWNKFANNPFRYLDERYVEPALEYKFRYFTFAFGLRYFSLYTYLFDDNNIKYIHTTYTSTAPLTIITCSISNNLLLHIRGWYEFINTESNKKHELANLIVRLKWNI